MVILHRDRYAFLVWVGLSFLPTELQTPSLLGDFLNALPLSIESRTANVRQGDPLPRERGVGAVRERELRREVTGHTTRKQGPWGRPGEGLLPSLQTHGLNSNIGKGRGHLREAVQALSET